MSVEILIRADTFQEEQPTPNPTVTTAAATLTTTTTTSRSSIPFSSPYSSQQFIYPARSQFPASSSSPHLVNEVNIDDEDEQAWKKSRCNLVSNLFILAVACMAMQTAFFVNNSMSDDDKLINYHHMGSWATRRGTGSFVFWVVFVLEKFIKIFDCLILPQYLIKKIGCKSTIFVSFLSYLIFYMTTRFYPLTYASYLGVFLNERK